jgi:hypothetical protein
MAESETEGNEPQIIHVMEEDMNKTRFPLEAGRETIMILDEGIYAPSD